MSMYASSWMKHISRQENNKLKTYSTIKEAFSLEPYLTQSKIFARRNITRLRISCHPLATKTGRYTKPKTPVENRICELCDRNCIEDENHMLLLCPFYSNESEKMINELNQYTSMNHTPLVYTFKTLLTLDGGNSDFITPVNSFIDTSFKNRKNALSTKKA